MFDATFVWLFVGFGLAFAAGYAFGATDQKDVRTSLKVELDAALDEIKELKEKVTSRRKKILTKS